MGTTQLPLGWQAQSVDCKKGEEILQWSQDILLPRCPELSQVTSGSSALSCLGEWSGCMTLGGHFTPKSLSFTSSKTGTVVLTLRLAVGMG